MLRGDKSPGILLWLVMAAGIVGFGCDAHKQGLDEKQKQAVMTFTNASKGLPSTGHWRHKIAISDLNGDGYRDILSTPPRKAAKDAAMPHVWYGDGKGEWTRADLHFPEDLGYDYGGIVADDFDQDGIVDIGLAMHGKRLTVLRGLGGGRFEDFSNGLPPGNEFMSRAVVAGQFDEDGSVELAAISEGPFGPGFPRPSGIRVCNLTQEGRWSCAKVGDPEMVKRLIADQLAIGDVNGDGWTDIAVASLDSLSSLIIWINDKKGNFTPFNQGFPEKLIFESVALADMNQDGRDDVAAAVSGIGERGIVGIKAFLSRADGWEDYSKGLPAEAFWCVDAYDMDHDGAMEIVGGTIEGGIRVFSLRTDGWQEVLASGLPKDGLKRIYGIYCRDVDGDGYGDVVVNYADDSTDSRGGIQVFLMQPKGAGGEAHTRQRG